MRASALTGDPVEPLHYPDDSSHALGRAWDVRRGFHAKPSMLHLHLHVRTAD